MNDAMRAKIIERRKIARGDYDNEIDSANQLQRESTRDYEKNYHQTLEDDIAAIITKIESLQSVEESPAIRIEYTGVISLLEMARNRLERIS